MTLSSQISSDVSKLLSEFEVSVTFTRPDNNGTYDPITGTITSGSDSSETAFGVFVNKNQVRDGSDIDEDRLFYMKPSGLNKAPRTGDELTEGSSTVKIRSVRTVRAGATVVTYICGVSE